MANITLGQLRDLWKNVSDWVTGVATHEPKVTLSGRSVAPIIERTLAVPQGLAVGAYWTQSGQAPDTISINGMLGAISIAAEFVSDQPLEVVLYAYHSLSSSDAFKVDSGYGTRVPIPFQPITAAGYYWQVKNIGASATTYVRATERLLALPFLDAGFIQTFPLDSGTITLAAGSSYTSPLFATRRLDGATLGVSCASRSATHEVVLVGAIDGSRPLWFEAATKQTWSGRDFYVVQTSKVARNMYVRIKNNGDSQVTFAAELSANAG